MNTNLFDTKEDIRARMLHNAMDYWGATNVNDMDPMVKLLIEALSTELYNVSNDVKNLENRALNKISRILASDYLTSSLPAHAILKADPIEPSEQLTTGHHFFYRPPVENDPARRAEQADIFFSPAGEVTLFQAAIRYACIGRNLFEIDNALHKNRLLNAPANAYTEPNTLWLGIECPQQLTSLHNLSLFIEWPDYAANDDFYKLLSVVTCETESGPLQTTPGLIYHEDADAANRPVFYEQNIINLITRDVKEYYNSRFITLSDDSLKNINTLKKSPPEVFARLFDNSMELNKLKPCIWLKLHFPAAIPPHVIDELHIATNCFPVMNRRLHNHKYRLRELNNIIPIKPTAEEHFLAVRELHDDRDTYYSEIPYTQAAHKFEGSYSIRNGGAERFDPRNAKQLIEYLFELIRDEKAAFASYGSDFLSSTLKTLEQNLSLIEKRSNAALNGTEPYNYIIVKPASKVSMLYLQYWTTMGETANNIRRGTKLQQFELYTVRPDALRLMTSTLGGRNNLGAGERIQAYKYGLVTKDRIVTQADLVSFCHYELGNKITGIRIGKGVAISGNPKEGFKKTVDIYLKPSEEVRLSAAEWDTLITLLLSKLESRSVINSHYRAFIE